MPDDGQRSSHRVPASPSGRGIDRGGAGHPRSGLLVVLCLLALLVPLAGCGQAAQPASPPPPAAAPLPRSFIGTVNATNALLAVVFDGSRALAYVCDGVPGEPQGTTPTVQAWFNVPSDGTTVAGRGANGSVDLQLSGAAMTGTFTAADGKSSAVRGQLVGDQAGLFRGEGQGVIAGWIAATDGSQRGGFGFEGGGGLGFEGGGGIKPINSTQLTQTIRFQNRSVSVQKVGITPIPIP